MSEINKRTITPPAWILSSDGRKRQLEKARWNVERITEIFADEPNKHFTVDDIARLVYGSNGKKNRDNVRKHIPAQRTYMLSRLSPIVTEYGARGRIMGVKLYDQTVELDRHRMSEELERLRIRKELTADKYDKLRELFGLNVIHNLKP